MQGTWGAYGGRRIISIGEQLGNLYYSVIFFKFNSIQKNFIATQDNVFYVQSQRMLQYIFLSQTYPSTYITWVIQVLTHCCQDKRSPPLDDILKCIFLSQTYPSTYIIWVIQVLTHCCRDKATAAPRRHSQMHLPEWKYVDFGQNSTETHPQGPNQQHSSIGADIGCFNPGYSFFLTTGSCVSEPPTRGLLCVRTRDTLNLTPQSNPLKSGPTSNRKLVTVCLTKIICTKDYIIRAEKVYVNKLCSDQAQIMVKSFVLISSNLAPSSKIQNLFGHMTPLPCHYHITLPLWLLGYQVIA